MTKSELLEELEEIAAPCRTIQEWAFGQPAYQQAMKDFTQQVEILLTNIIEQLPD